MPACERTQVKDIPATFWVWNRDSPLSAHERDTLRGSNVLRLFWHVGELEMQGPALTWKEEHPLPADTETLRFIPTIRINAQASSPSQWAASLIERVKPWREFQLDFDCKTTRLREYQAALRQVRAALPGRRLSITALAHWPQAPHWRELMREVDEVFPMFYDLELDAPLPQGARPRPMIEPAIVSKWVKAWKGCPVPWHLGLPNMTRVTVLGRTGSKHLRTWDQETLNSLGPPTFCDGPGMILWESKNDGGLTALRRPAAADLRAAIDAGRRAGAAGVIWFSLPEEGRAARGWSVPHLQRLCADGRHGPSFTLAARKVEGGYRLALHNAGDQDAVNDIKGCVLKLSVNPGELKEVLAGDFTETAFLRAGSPEADPRKADEARLVFPRLDSDGTLETALARFSSGKPQAGLYWKVQCDTNEDAINHYVPFNE